MTISTTIAFAQQRAMTVPGVVYAPPGNYPPALDTALLPAVLTFPGPAEVPTYSRSARDLYSVTRTYYVTFYLNTLGQGNRNNKIQDGIVMLQEALDAFLHNRHLDSDVVIMGVTNDTGITSGRETAGVNDQYLTYNGQPYFGFVLSVNIEEVNL